MQSKNINLAQTSLLTLTMEGGNTITFVRTCAGLFGSCGFG